MHEGGRRGVARDDMITLGVLFWRVQLSVRAVRLPPTRHRLGTGFDLTHTTQHSTGRHTSIDQPSSHARSLAGASKFKGTRYGAVTRYTRHAPDPPDVQRRPSTSPTGSTPHTRHRRTPRRHASRGAFHTQKRHCTPHAETPLHGRDRTHSCRRLLDVFLCHCPLEPLSSLISHSSVSSWGQRTITPAAPDQGRTRPAQPQERETTCGPSGKLRSEQKRDGQQKLR